MIKKGVDIDVSYMMTIERMGEKKKKKAILTILLVGYLSKLLIELWGNFTPLRNSIAEWSETLNQTLRVYLDHGTQAAEGSILLIIVSNRAASVAPGLGKGFKMRSNQLWANQTKTADRNRRVVQECSGCGLVRQQWDQSLQQGLNPDAHILAVLKRNLSCSPGRIVANGDKVSVGLNLSDQLVHKGVQIGLDVHETADGKVTQESIGRLTDLGGRICQTNAQNLKNAWLTRSNQTFNAGIQTLGQAAEKIQSHNHKVLVRLKDVLGVLDVHLCLHEIGMYDLDAAFKDWGRERQESLAQSRGDR